MLGISVNSVKFDGWEWKLEAASFFTFTSPRSWAFAKKESSVATQHLAGFFLTNSVLLDTCTLSLVGLLHFPSAVSRVSNTFLVVLENYKCIHYLLLKFFVFFGRILIAQVNSVSVFNLYFTNYQIFIIYPFTYCLN